MRLGPQIVLGRSARYPVVCFLGATNARWAFELCRGAPVTLDETASVVRASREHVGDTPVHESPQT